MVEPGRTSGAEPARPAPGLVSLLVHGQVDDSLCVDRALVANAVRHRVAGLLHHAVKAHGLAVDPEVQRLLAQRYLAITAHARKAREAAAGVADAAGSEFGFAIAKGLALDTLLYSDDEARTSGDVDVVVHPDDHHQLGSFVARIARASDDAAAGIDDAQVAQLNAAGSTVAFAWDVRTFGGVELDIHTDIAKFGPRPLRQTELMWAHMVVDPDLGLLRPDAELSLILSVVHLARDGFVDLRRHVDVARLLRLDLDWDFIEQFVRGEGWWRAFCAALDVICDGIGLEHPLPRAANSVRRLADAIVWPSSLRLAGQHMRFAFTPVWQTVALGLLFDRPVSTVARSIALLAYPPRARVAAVDMSGPRSVLHAVTYWWGHARKWEYVANGVRIVRRVIDDRRGSRR